MDGAAHACMLQSVIFSFERNSMGIHGKIDHELVVGLGRGLNNTRFEKQTGRDGKIQVQSLSESSIAPFLVDTAFGVRGEIAKSVAYLKARAVYLDTDLAEFAIPIFVFRIISQRVIGRA